MSFRAPIGTEEERNSGMIWPPGWDDATGYLNSREPSYRYGIHTGADLNWNSPRFDADRLAPVYSIGDGIVTYARPWPNVKYWGNIIVINHGMVDGKPLFSRYAHVANMLVSEKQLVRTGQQICQIGDGSSSLPGSKPLFPFHLHFDISNTDILGREPNNWPAPAKLRNPDLVKQHYVDPRDWLRQHLHAVQNIVTTDNVDSGPQPSATSIVWHVIATAGAQVYKDHSMSAEKVDLVPFGSTLSIEAGGGNQEGYTWGQISGGKFSGCWLAIRKQDQSESYLSTNPPR
ncbi:MAG TPA: M23 family metallopeptidase [Anaerolineales bacterium]